LSSEYTAELRASDLIIQIKNDIKNYSRDLYIMRVDDAAKTFTVKFNGAPPESYYFAVASQATDGNGNPYGRLSTAAISFQTSSTVTNVSPSTGSVFGGTLLTITGTNFSTNKEDHAVKVGDTYCDILTATATQLTCRVRATGLTASDAGEVRVLVFLAASWEASCPVSANCNFTL